MHVCTCICVCVWVWTCVCEWVWVHARVCLCVHAADYVVRVPACVFDSVSKKRTMKVYTLLPLKFSCVCACLSWYRSVCMHQHTECGRL